MTEEIMSRKIYEINQNKERRIRMEMISSITFRKFVTVISYKMMYCVTN